MTGLDKIIGQIKSESDAAAAQTTAKARAKADQILEEARAQAKAECARIEQASAADVADRLSRSRSAADLQKRRTILAEKQRLISGIIEKAKQSLGTLPDGEYFDIIVRMAKRSALPEEGTILFSAKDRARLPEGFEAVLNSAIQDKGGKLVVSSETRNIDGGFVLAYGGVEENCSFTALFDSAHEFLQDKVQELLFS